MRCQLFSRSFSFSSTRAPRSRNGFFPCYGARSNPVLCSLPGARTVNGSLSIADFNFSSARSRQDRAKLLGTRCGAKDLDWNGLVEELCQRVLQADRAGQPAVDLRTLARPSTDDDMLVVEGLALPRRHPSIAFGDGGAGKSYLGLYLGGR